MKFINVDRAKQEDFMVNKPGKYVYFLKNYSGDVKIDILSPQVEVYIFGLYVGRSSEQYKLNTIQHHKVGRSMSDLFIKGVFYDESKFFYEGLIHIDKNAQKSNAYQKNQNLILSNKVFVDSRPFLEIEANDVRCTHGSTTGKLNQDELYYLQTRGIGIMESQELLIEGFKQEIYDRMRSLGVDTDSI